MTATSNREHKILLNPFRFLQFKYTGNIDRNLHRFILTQLRPFLSAHRQTSHFSSMDELSVLLDSQPSKARQ